jgi:hypothetical protein
VAWDLGEAGHEDPVLRSDQQRAHDEFRIALVKVEGDYR